mgnify:CR=1 FL=1
MMLTIGTTELVVLAAVVLAVVRPGIFNRILRLVDDYLFADVKILEGKDAGEAFELSKSSSSRVSGWS